jgi:hypothetical protein
MQRMRRKQVRLWVVLATVLVAWHGLLIRLPHTDLDNQVPRYEGTCSVAHPGSHAFHFHPTPAQLGPHQCIACLVSSTTAAPCGGSSVPTPQGVTASALSAPTGMPVVKRAYLPDLRAPPVLS